MKRIKIEKSSQQLFITPSVGFVNIRLFDEKYTNLCFAWFNFLISIRIWEKKGKEDTENANPAN